MHKPVKSRFAESEAAPGDKRESNDLERNGFNGNQSSSEEASSDWDDWKDPEYIEEQRKALAEFSAKQIEITVQHHAKKKKKSKKKKKKFRSNFGQDDVYASEEPGIIVEQVDEEAKEYTVEEE